MKSYSINIIEDAEQDLVDIYRYMSFHDHEKNTDQLLDKLESLCLSLDSLPLRGNIPPELDRIGVTNYHEVHLKPYRIIYEVIESSVFIHCVMDGRRDLLSVLERRLLR